MSSMLFFTHMQNATAATRLKLEKLCDAADHSMPGSTAQKEWAAAFDAFMHDPASFDAEDTAAAAAAQAHADRIAAATAEAAGAVRH